jgi:benzoyl-CoA reductase/2-hydroxyglutaryl-CoA dehydratase subunit BcrC/BadD/HgdB
MALEQLLQHYQRRERDAKEWKAKGGKVAGYVGVDVPEELLMAAGFLPIRITPDPVGSVELAARYFRPNFNPVLMSILNRILDGTYAFLDRLILSNSSESVLQLFYVLREIQRLEPYEGLPKLHFLDFLHTRYRTTALYNRDRVAEFKQRIEGWIGNELDGDQVERTIAVCNENRRLLLRIARLRTEDSPRISGVEALQITGASMLMKKDEHNGLLHKLLEKADQLPEREGVRLFLEGSSVGDLSVYEIIESCRAIVVAEDSDWGNRYFDKLIDETIDPLTAITDRYHFKAPSPNKSTIQQRVEYCVRKVKEAKADGVIFYIIEGENPPSWDYPEQRKALEEMGVATLLLPHQPYRLNNPEELKSRINSFIHALVPV